MLEPLKSTAQNLKLDVWDVKTIEDILTGKKIQEDPFLGHGQCP